MHSIVAEYEQDHPAAWGYYIPNLAQIQGMFLKIFDASWRKASDLDRHQLVHGDLRYVAITGCLSRGD